MEMYWLYWFEYEGKLGGGDILMSTVYIMGNTKIVYTRDMVSYICVLGW